MINNGSIHTIQAKAELTSHISRTKSGRNMRLHANLTSRLLLASLVIATLFLPTPGLGVDRPAYNVLLVTLDTTRADRLGLYGYARPTSPNLDRLATQATVFDLGISQAAVTPVSHASILTGLYPYHHGLRVMHGLVGQRLAEDQVTLAETWRAAGGQTAAFVSAYPVTSDFGLDQGFSKFDADFNQADGKGLVSPTGAVNTGMSQRRGDATTDAALAWLGSYRAQDKPFLMWVHYFDPHDALVLPPRPLVDSLMYGALGPVSNNDPDVARALYDCELFYMDRQLGRLLKTLKTRGLWDRTIVVVVADHGEGLGEHDWWSHGILFQEQIRVPYVVRVPGIGAGQRVPSLVRSIDLMPTILDASGIARAKWPKMDGESLVVALKTGKTAKPLDAYSGAVSICSYARPDNYGTREEKTDKMYCLMNARYKLVYHQLFPKQSEFYDLLKDPEETKNLYAAAPPEMKEMLRDLRERRALSALMPGMTATDLERIKRLESLGYIN
jgi:arylsulfatase A-like enzyme